MHTAANNNDVSFRKARRIVDNVFELVATDIANGKTVVVPKLGSFSAKDYKSQQIKDINTGEYITIPARRKVKYTPNKWILTQINE